MLEHKHKGILSLKLIKLSDRDDHLKIILILQNEMLLLMLFCKHVLNEREDTPKYGKTINNYLLGTACSAIFCANCLFKNILMHLSTKVFSFNTSFN